MRLKVGKREGELMWQDLQGSLIEVGGKEAKVGKVRTRVKM